MRTWNPTPLEAPTGSLGLERIALKLRFITPVFGGGVDPKKTDEVTPVRASAIRGQLRFWWRATSPLSEVQELRHAEAALFGGVHGSAPQASRISVVVTKQPRRATPKPVLRDGTRFKRAQGIGQGMAYGAFPLRAEAEPWEHDKLYRFNDDFEIELRFPAKDRTDVERALAAWLRFGGLGGRTRRGFGAVELSGDGSDEISCSEVVYGNAGAPWPVLATYVTSDQAFPDAARAHEFALRTLFEMRQGPGDGREPEGRPSENGVPPGRSRWPEPDAIRRAFPRGLLGPHATTPKLSIDAFPRAAFGAPIIFEFQTRQGEVEPAATILLPKGVNRRASPLLVRPHRGSDGRYRVLAAYVREPVDSWELLEGRARRRDDATQMRKQVRVELRPEEAACITPLEGAPDPIEAYFARLRNS